MSIDDIQILPTTPPDCPACETPMKWSTVELEDGGLAECPKCGHMTPVWTFEPEEA